MATVHPGMVMWGFTLGVLGNVGYEGALVYYNAYLPDLAPPSHQGRVSGWGFATGYAGSIVALFAAYPFVQAENYGGAFLTTAAIFAAQTLGFPMGRLIVLYIVVQVSALLGALAWAWPTDKLGPKRVVMVTLCQWTAV